MKIIIFLGLLGATLSAPLIPRGLLSASNSNELLLNLNNGQLLPLRLQGPLASWMPAFPGVPLQPAPPPPGLPQISLSPLDRLVGLFPSEAPFPRPAGFVPGARTAPLAPPRPQAPQGPSPAGAHLLPFGAAQDPAQHTPQYYPVFMYLPWEQPQQAATPGPRQAGPQPPEEQIPFYFSYGYIPQPAETGAPGGQQLSVLDAPLDAAPETVVMPAGVMPYVQKEGPDSGHEQAGGPVRTPSPTPSPATVRPAAADPAAVSVLPEEKAMTDSLREP